MRKISITLLITVFLSILLVSGCEKKDPNIDIKKLAIGVTKQEVEKIIGEKLEYDFSDKKEDANGLKLNDFSFKLQVSFEDQKVNGYTLEFYTKKGEEIRDYISDAFSIEPVSCLPSIFHEECYRWDVSSNEEVNYKTITFYCSNGEENLSDENSVMYINNEAIDQDSIISTEKKEPAISATEAEKILTDYLETGGGIYELKKEMLADHSWSEIEECEVTTIERNSDEDGHELSRDQKKYIYHYYFTLKGKLKVIDEYGKKETEYYECSADVSDQEKINFDTWYPRMKLIDN